MLGERAALAGSAGDIHGVGRLLALANRAISRAGAGVNAGLADDRGDGIAVGREECGAASERGGEGLGEGGGGCDVHGFLVPVFKIMSATY